MSSPDDPTISGGNALPHASQKQLKEIISLVEQIRLTDLNTHNSSVIGLSWELIVTLSDSVTRLRREITEAETFRRNADKELIKAHIGDLNAALTGARENLEDTYRDVARLNTELKVKEDETASMQAEIVRLKGKNKNLRAHNVESMERLQEVYRKITLEDD